MTQNLEQPISVVLVGTGGYGGAYYVPRLLEASARGSLRLAGAVNPPKLPANEMLLEEVIPFYPDLDTFFAHQQAELAILSGPIYTHCPQTLTALGHGVHVLCEKPAAATRAEVQRMMEAETRSGRHVAVGFQWAFSQAAQDLKADIQSGRFGRPVRLKSLVLWPRAQSYYQRNDWAGKLHMPDGREVVDSPVQNAMAHYLQILFYILGAERETSAGVAEVQAELFRANPIENYDTAALRCRTETGVEILFYVSHCVLENRHPLLRLEFEQATIEYDGMGERRFSASLANGSLVDYGDPEETTDRKIWDMLAAARGGRAPACGLSAAMVHTRCVELAQQYPIQSFPAEQVRLDDPDGDPLIWVEGLAEELWHCFEHNQLPSEIHYRKHP